MADNYTLAVARPDLPSLMKSAQDWLDEAKSVVIDSPTMYEVAAEELGDMRRQRTAIDDTRKEATRPLDDLKKQMMDDVRPALDMYDSGISILANAMTTYVRMIEAQQRKEQLLADQRAAAERDRLAAIEMEKAAEARELRKQAEQAEQAGNLVVADELDKQAGAAAQDAMEVAQERSMVTASATLVGPTPKGTVRVWKARVIDYGALFAACVGKPELMALFDINQTKLNAMAKAQGKHLLLPGVEAYQDLSVRGK